MRVDTATETNNFSFDFILQRTATLLSVAILTITLVAAVSGILIAFYYEPAAGAAYSSLDRISQEIPFGWLVYSLHSWAGNGVIVVALVQLVVMFLGRQFRRNWLTAWVSNVLLVLAVMGLSWTAMILGWNQLGFWRLKVELGIIESIPFLGESIRSILTGGNGVNTTTIAHFYTLHSYVVSTAAIALAVVHLVALVLQEQKQKQSVLAQLENLVSSEAESHTDVEAREVEVANRQS